MQLFLLCWSIQVFTTHVATGKRFMKSEGYLRVTILNFVVADPFKSFAGHMTRRGTKPLKFTLLFQLYFHSKCIPVTQPVLYLMCQELAWYLLNSHTSHQMSQKCILRFTPLNFSWFLRSEHVLNSSQSKCFSIASSDYKFRENKIIENNKSTVLVNIL